MSEIKDMTGQTFGKLLVIGRADDKIYKNGKRKIMWHCKCECGNEIDVLGSCLRHGDTKSCGCLKHQTASNFKDLTGQKFGKLTVIKRVENKNNKVCWECKCECGNIVNVCASELRENGTKSCGCLRRDNFIKNTKDLTGMKFGKWTVLHNSDDEHKYNYWWCKCDCGTEREVNGLSLVKGFSKSCGCFQKDTAKNTGYKNTKTNTYDLSGEYGIGYTLKGEAFYFDLEDYEKIRDYCWCYNKEKYVYTRIRQSTKRIFMHRMIYNVDKGYEVDHINHTPYDNRKENLRIVTRSQNNMNHGINSRNTSGVTGVSYHNSLQKWVAEISVNKKKIHLGVFDNLEDAAKIRKEAEIKYFGEYRYQNPKNEMGGEINEDSSGR